jgi:hypothetical protein
VRAPYHPAIALAALTLLAAFATPTPAAGQIPVPGGPVDPGPAAHAEWIRYQRVLADSMVRDLITVLEREDGEGLARLVTDRAHVTGAAGESAHGREGVAEFLDRLPPRADYQAHVSRVTAAPRLVHAAGRIQFDGSDGRGSELFDMLLERHHGWWQIRALVFASADEPLARSPLPPGRVTPREDRVPLPERTLVRVVVEPMVARGQPLEAGAEIRSGYGAGIGLEFNRTLEMRGFGWKRGGAAPDEDLVKYGGELRLHLFDWGRVRPFLTAGATWFDGGAAPDSAWVPTVGGGLSVRLLSHLDLQVSVRDYLVTTPDGIEEGIWLAEKRRHHPFLSAGLSLGIGRRPGWRDAPPTEHQRDYEAGNSGLVLARVNGLRNAVGQEDRAALASLYAAGGRMYVDGEIHGVTDAMLDALRDAGAHRSGQVSQLRMSDRIAYVDMILDGDASRRLLTVLLREDGEWKIQFQTLHGS